MIGRIKRAYLKKKTPQERRRTSKIHREISCSIVNIQNIPKPCHHRHCYRNFLLNCQSKDVQTTQLSQDQNN